MIITNDWWEKKRKEINNSLRSKFQHSSPLKATKIEKIILNSGVSQAVSNKTFLDNSAQALGQISGQKPVLTLAKKSIINFKLREGTPIGCKVTLRKKRAWDFLFELININLPRIPNFQGFSQRKFDKFGNYNFGINNMSIFPVLAYDLIFKNQGLQVTIVFSSFVQEENSQFLKLLGFPFQVE